MDRTPKHNNAPYGEQLQKQMNTETPTQQSPEFPPSDRLGGDQEKQSQVPSDLQNRTGGEVGNFPANIEELIAAYILHHAGRIPKGEITIYVKHDWKGNAVVSYFGTPPDTRGVLLSSPSIKDSGDALVKWLAENNPEKIKAREIASLEMRLAELKGEGGAE